MLAPDIILFQQPSGNDGYKKSEAYAAEWAKKRPDGKKRSKL